VTAPTVVLYVAWAPFYSGAERALLLTVRSLDRGRFTPVVALGTDGELRAQLEADRVPTLVVPLRYADRRHPVAWLRSVSAIALAARRHRAGLVHANDCPSFQPAGYAARLLGLGALTHVRFPDTRNGFAWFLRPGFRKAVFVSRYLEEDALTAAPELFRGQTAVVYDGVELPPVPGDEATAGLRRSLGLPPDRPAVVIAGQVAEVKGIWEFIEAACLIRSRGTQATFVVLGDDLKDGGKTRVAAEERVRALGLSADFRFLGFRPNASRLMPAFDVVAVPSRVEPLGNATLEAMAAGRPVVGSRVGGIPEMVLDGETGRLVPSRAPDALADALEPLLQDPALRKRLGRAGRARAEACFGLQAHAARLCGLYDEVLHRQPRPQPGPPKDSAAGAP
jgi:glycosyltransferase involved in cell wall biosynthesis